MPKTSPPEGYVGMGEALEYLHTHGKEISSSMFYKYIKAGRITGYGPRKHKYYSLAELDRFVEEEKGLRLGNIPHMEISFARATLGDLEGITNVSAKLFNTPTLRPISTETRRAWLLKEPRGHYVVKQPNGEVVAWLHLLALTNEKITEYMAGQITGRHLTGEDVQVLTPGKSLSCIVASIGSDPDIKNASLRRRCISILLHGVSLDIALLGLQGIVISRLHAWSESKEGILMCARMGMQQYAPPIKHRYTYYLDVLESTSPLVKGYQQALSEWRHEHPGRAVPEVSPRHATTRPTMLQPRATLPVKSTLLEGLAAFTQFCERHQLAPSTVKNAINKGYLEAIRGEWKIGRAIVKEAFTEEQQRACLLRYPHHTKCEDPACPCHRL